VPYVRTVKTKSGATAVQVVWSSRRGSRETGHIGSAHDEGELEALRAAAGQLELDLRLDGPGAGAPLPITSSRTGHLLDALDRGYQALGLDGAAGGDEVFRQLVLARIIEPASKFDSLRVLGEARVPPPSYATVKRRLPQYAEGTWRQRLSQACAAHARLGPASLVLYDVSTLYYEAHQGDGFREPGFSRERRLEPQVTIGLLTDQSGFPLMLSAFEGNRAETKTMLPVIREFMAAHRLADVTVVADAGMISDANMKAIEAEGLSFILGMKVPDVPYVVDLWRREHPGEDIPDGRVFTQPWPAGPKDKRRDQVTCYQYRADRARRTLHGTGEQVAKAAMAVAGLAPVKRNRFIQLDGAVKSVNRELEERPGPWPGSRATRPTSPPPPTASPSRPPSSSVPTTNCGTPGKASGCRSRTCKPGPSTTASATPSRPTWRSSSPPSPSPAGSKREPAGRSGGSSAPPAATAPSRSRPASTSSPPPTPSPTTYAKPSTPSKTPTDLRTKLSQLRSEDEVYRVRHQLAVEEYERRKAAEQNKPSFLRWLGGVGLGFVVTKILEWLWTTIRRSFGLI
jgi:hypothetical protein